MTSRWILALLAIPAFAAPAAAQFLTGKSLEFNTFLRVAPLIGKAVSELGPVWATRSAVTTSERVVHLTGAHSIFVFEAPVPGARDTSHVIQRMRYAEQVSDTLTLKLRVLSIELDIDAVDRRANRCNTLLGGPSFLYAPQTVTREWDRGLLGQPTRLQWTVTADNRYLITVEIGRLVDDGIATFPCQVSLP
jgi:hypothetical protein